MSDDTEPAEPVEPEVMRPRARLEVDAATVERLASAAMAVIVLDQLTGRHLSTALRLLAARARYSMRRHEMVIPPPTISALHNEARAITREAAEDA